MIILILVAVSFLGVFIHWLKSWCRNQVQSNFIGYSVGEPKHTMLTMMSLMAALFALYSNGNFSDLSHQTLALVFFTGFSADSAFNKEADND